MSSDSFKDIEKLETDLWEAADNLRANSKLTSSDYFMPVLGVIFLRHAANRFDAAHRQIEADQASGKMPKRKVLPADYIARRSLYLPEQARYDWIMQQAAVSGADLPKLVTEAMTAIEAGFEPLQGVLPKDYGIFETKVLEDLMRLFSSERIRQAIDVLREIDVFIRFLSVEPLLENLGEIDLTGIQWVIVGGESGRKARPMKPEWVDGIKRQCDRDNVAFFFKQWGTWGADGQKRSKGANGRKYQGQIWDGMPELSAAL